MAFFEWEDAGVTGQAASVSKDRAVDSGAATNVEDKDQEELLRAVGVVPSFARAVAAELSAATARSGNCPLPPPP